MAARSRIISSSYKLFHFRPDILVLRDTFKLGTYKRVLTYPNYFKKTSVLWLKILHRGLRILRTRGLSSSVAASIVVACSDLKNNLETANVTLAYLDKLFDNNEIERLYNYLHKFKDSDDPKLLWRFARAARNFAQFSGTSDESKKCLIYEAFHAADRAVKLDDNSFACNKWFGIMLSEVGDYEGTKKKIENSYIIRDHFLRAIELNPADPTSHYLLGVWYFTFADLPWYQKKLAAAIFASPPNCTYEEAAEHFLHAEKIEPGFYTANRLMLAKTYLRLGQKDVAKKWIEQLLECPVVTQEDKQNIEEGRKFLSSF